MKKFFFWVSVGVVAIVSILFFKALAGMSGNEGLMNLAAKV